MSQDSHSPAILPISRSFSSISLDDEAPMCRICHNAGGKQGGREPLHKVCWCRGTMGEVHKSCLELWLSAVHNDRCPVCHFHFQTNRVYKPISQWRCPSMQANDVAILVLTVCFIGMFAVQLSGIFILISYYRQPSCHVSISLGIAGIATGLPFFLAFSIGLFVNAYFSRYWVNWRRINKRVTVNLGNSNEPNIVPV
ncbi:PREDICTED: E3 ubiquitin-protein ligase MARCH3-like [Acropora digitifera]|uniref:E3 ubiquitin-protein ligase MARCH3-like n=1 Tax=Acropora digitifera TaxID=70779 RepID=UPI00077AE5E2|nr:PREDICTED: E3 ubiquitin-protein ligase MARCH3-like [Acropora digitifera]